MNKKEREYEHDPFWLPVCKNCRNGIERQNVEFNINALSLTSKKIVVCDLDNETVGERSTCKHFLIKKHCEDTVYEDELPELTKEEYDIWFKHSWVDGVRVGPRIIKLADKTLIYEKNGLQKVMTMKIIETGEIE